MAKVNAAEFAEKHARRLKAALEDVRKGIDRVTEAPGAKAAKKADKMKLKINEALDSGKWARNVGAVSLEEWKTKMKDKGVARIPAGIDASKAKVEAFAEKLLSHIDTGLSAVKAMPDLTIEDSKARVMAWIDHMAKFKK